MSADGWEQRLTDLGQARELREEIADALMPAMRDAMDAWTESEWEASTHLADVLLSGPLVPLLAALSTKQHNHTRFTNDSGATWSSCPKSCPVAIHRALDGPT